jgi:hypothetical protein
MNDSRVRILIGLLSTVLLVVGLMLPLRAAENPPAPPAKETTEKEAAKPDFPPMEKVLEGYEKVISTTDGKSLYTIWTRAKDAQMLAVLPPDYEGKKYFIALTIASGEDYAGLQAGDMYVYWRRYNDRLALVEPNIEIKSTGDDESKNSVKRLFTDRVILDVPIVTVGKDSSVVIDMDALLIGQCEKFFGSRFKVSNPKLVKIQEAKAFPENVELAFEVPSAQGRLQTLHYSISVIPQNTGYKPRKADSRIGYFTTTFSDYGQFKDPETKVRYVNRWNLEKADSSLQVSPPKNPIVFYIENTTPVRYRRWVRQGILYWNQAFEKVGISNAIEVYYQDKKSGAHMEKDPEDVRYNFIRWLSNNQGTAIGPSRVNPETGQILDADVILTDGWIRHYWTQYNKVMPQIAMEGFSPETLAWLADHPRWDPRIRLAPPAQREYMQQQIAQERGMPYGGHPITRVRPELIGDDEYDGLAGTMCQRNGLCTLEWGMAFDVAMFRMEQALAGADDEEKDKAKDGKKDEDKEKDKDKEPTIDGMPESFIGPLLAELTCHEVGHTLGLRHNFKASSTYTMAEINSKAMKATKPQAGSVMDYLPVNMNFQDGEVQGDYCMISVGPYDVWAIEYGYGQDEAKLKDILSRVAEPELQYATDEDTFGPDPLARRYDFSKDPLDYARNQMRIAKRNRERIISDLVKDGDSWAKTRRYYELTLGMQMRAVSMMANWLGGDFIHRDKKGDKNGRAPIEPVSAKQQRDALTFVVETTFQDQAYGLTPELLTHMAEEKWWDDVSSIFADATWPVHDQIMGLQAYTLTMLMKPDTLQRIYDNELITTAQTDVVTLPELLETIKQAVWTELDQPAGAKHDARNPMISSLRRNLQREHLERLIDLTRSDILGSAVYKPICTLVVEQLRQLKAKIDPVLDTYKDSFDPYTLAHLKDASVQIQKALDAHYVYQTL